MDLTVGPRFNAAPALSFVLGYARGASEGHAAG